jgi:ribonuclease HII
MPAETLDRSTEYSLSSGYEHVIGVDEAGRGPLAGPVVVAACFIPRELSNSIDAVIQDSKKMTEEQRDVGYEVLMSEPRIKYAVSIVSHTEIDEMNILQASLTGMRRATIELLDILRNESMNTITKKGKPKQQSADPKNLFSASSFLVLVDGNKVPASMPIECKAIVKGDSRVYSIAAASIIAKVVRDKLMVDLDKEYPQYNFAKHKGYPTAEHRALVMQHGPCPYHRLTYGPVRAALEAKDRRESKRPLEQDVPATGTTTKKRRTTSAELQDNINTIDLQAASDSIAKKRLKAKSFAPAKSENAIDLVSNNNELRRSSRLKTKQQ